MKLKPADESRLRGLKRMRLVALSLLVFAAVVFLATLGVEPNSVLGYVHTASEAAMVGGLADWFAVTALFRHPLGIPVPHTAIIQKRKNEIGRNLQEFVTDNFLTEEIARERLAAAHVGHRLGVWLGEQPNRDRVMREAVTIGRAALGRLKDDEVHDVVANFVLPRLSQEPISPIAGSLLEGIVEHQSHTGLVDLTLDHFGEWLRQNPGTFAAVIGERAPWWSPPFLDDKVIGWTYQQLLTWLRDIRVDAQHPVRKALDDLLRRLADDLQHDDEVIAKAESLKERLLAHPQVPVTVVALWNSFKAALLAAMDDPDSYFFRRGDELLADLGTRFREDAVWRDKLEARLGELVSFFVNTYGAELSEVISITVDRWDAKEASERIELHVGKDLQFIRINGTVVGALAGLAIHTVAQVVG